MNKKVFDEVKKIIKKVDLDVKLNQSEDKIIEEFEDKMAWYWISEHQQLSEGFMRKFKDDVDWSDISTCQKLSEGFIREFKNKVHWEYISKYQKLSEGFIKEFKDDVSWIYISKYQNLSKNFLNEFKDKIDIKLYNRIHKQKTLDQKTKEVKEYVQKYNLKVDKKYFYAYRNHDHQNRGMFNKTISYKKSKYYRDWHCDTRKDEEASFGYGIWPEGNTSVKIKIEDWGCSVNKNDGKARVWGFEII